MMQQIQKLQEQLQQTQEQLAQEVVTGAAGGGAVKVSVTGDQRVRVSSLTLKCSRMVMWRCCRI